MNPAKPTIQFWASEMGTEPLTGCAFVHSESQRFVPTCAPAKIKWNQTVRLKYTNPLDLMYVHITDAFT